MKVSLTEITNRWQSLSWEMFQEISIHAAHSKFPKYSFEEYLKKGNKQDGIDILSSIGSNQKYISLQCKKVKKLTEYDIRSILAQFINNRFIERCSIFIIATTADLNSKTLQELKDRLTKEIDEEYKVRVLFWDINFFKIHFKDFYSIIEYYFDRAFADLLCFRPYRPDEKHLVKQVTPFIPRYVTTIPLRQTNTFKYSLFQVELQKLKDLIIKDRMYTKQICLIGDAYQGKTILLKQTAFELQNIDTPFVCLFLEIKHSNIRPLDEILRARFFNWESIPTKDMVIFIDGLDEVPTDKFISAINYIKEFSDSYPFINLVFSCRKLFYNHYQVYNTLSDFTFNELYQIQHADTHQYLMDTLGKLYGKFNDEINKSSIGALLLHPFYLTNIVDEFKKPPYRLPANKLTIIDRLVANSLNQSKLRKLASGHIFQHKLVLYNRTIHKLSFALQLSGQNSFSDTEIQDLFSETEIELLQHSSLVTSNGKSWSFSNAIFQEHLCAAVLSSFKFDEIINCVSIGKVNKKIRTKWIQTVSSLLSLLDTQTPLYKKLLRFVEHDNIELLFQTESSKYNSDQRFDLLKKVTERLIKYNMRPMLLFEDSIGSFINEDIQCINFIIQKLKKEKNTEHIEDVLFRILRNVTLDEDQRRVLSEIAISKAQKTDNAYFAGQMVACIVELEVNMSERLSQIFSITKFEQVHEFRQGVYNLIVKTNKVDEYYEYGLDGFRYLVEYNRSISRYGSEVSLELFLKSANKISNLSLLLNRMTEDDWVTFYNYRSSGKEFLKYIIGKCISLFKENFEIFFPLTKFLKELGRKYLRDQYKDIDVFFESSLSFDDRNICWVTVRHLINEIVIAKDWELGGLISEDSFDYLLFELEEFDFALPNYRHCIAALRYKGKNDIADKLLQLCNDATEGQLIEKANESEIEIYKANELRRQKNDLNYIRSIKNFKTGITKFFAEHSSKSLDIEDILIEFDALKSKSRFDSNLILHLIYHWMPRRATVSLKSCLNYIETPVRYDYFRAEEILKDQSLFQNKQCIKILEDYYQREIRITDFKNAYYPVGDRIMRKDKQNQLVEIFMKFSFDTPTNILMDFIWLDMGGIRTIRDNEVTNNKSISETILELLDENEVFEFRNKVLKNLMDGEIKSDTIFGTHIAICKHLRIVEAKDIVYEYILTMSGENYSLSDYVNVFIDLEGEPKDLLALIEKQDHINNFGYFHLVRLLLNDFPGVVKTSLQELLKVPALAPETRIYANQYLAQLKVNSGFAYLVEFVRINKKSPYNIQGDMRVSNVSTSYALKQMEDIIYLLVDPVYETAHFSDSAKSIIVEWLYAFASKSETDLKLVHEFLFRSEKALRSKHPNSSWLFWYAFRAQENFRNSADKNLSFGSVKKAAEKFIQGFN